MIEFLKSWVINIITLVVFILLLEILIPSGKMKKYINMVTGFVLIIAIINPFIGWFKKGMDLKEFQIADSNYIDRKEIEQNSKILKEQQMKQITETYRRKIIRQIEEGIKEIKGASGSKVDVIINEDFQADSFGEVKRVYVTLGPGKESSEIKPVAKVGKIQISRDKGNELQKEDHSIQGVNPETKNLIEDKINKLLEVKKENIVITQR